MINNGIKEREAEFRRRCRRHGLRITPQRIAIYARLTIARNHPSATELYEQVKAEFPEITLGTVNRTLLAFADIGLARAVVASGEPKRFDPDTAAHHHFHCVKCSRIVDFRDASYDALKVPSEICEKYVVLGKTMTLEGICDDCQKRKKEVHRGRRTEKTDQ